MHFEQFFVEGLGHQSYLVGSDRTGEALVVDPRRDVAVYLDAARQADLQIRYVLETHSHNDFVSGAKELAAATGADYVAAAEAGLAFSYRRVRDGDELRLGELLVRVLRTPGHTPEHISYTLYDTSRTEAAPLAVFTGGDLLVGAVGRPDLLGERIGEELAPQLYDSLYGRLLPLGDGVLVLPTHGAGSLCGRGIVATRISTIGYEKLTNPALQHPDRAAFVQQVLAGSPAIPAYFARMRPLNQSGPAPFTPLEPCPLTPVAVQHLQAHDAAVLDVRPSGSFGGGHIPGAYNVPPGAMLATWAGWTVPPDVPLVLVLERPGDWEPVTTALRRVGFERFAGYVQGGMTLWQESALPVARVEQLSVAEVNRRRAERPAVQVLDVRTEGEWEQGHIPGALHAPLTGELAADVAALGLDPARPVAVVCGTGYRSSIATGLLRQQGFRAVVNTLGGMTAWQAADLPLTTAGAPPPEREPQTSR